MSKPEGAKATKLKPKYPPGTYEVTGWGGPESSGRLHTGSAVWSFDRPREAIDYCAANGLAFRWHDSLDKYKGTFMGD
tara:strand:- start:2074 stop:2307 length:234 start_codon:yes stop_codon:yes gene_type:complete